MFRRYPLLGALLIAYFAASLVHFIHNAEHLASYPGLPSSWTRGGVYSAWLGMTAVGACGWLVLTRGIAIIGLALLAIYACLGLDSLAHYVLARFVDHSVAMNVTIVAEVSAAALVLCEVVRQAASTIAARRPRRPSPAR